MEYVHVKTCRIDGCGRPCWEGGDVCPRCREEIEQVPMPEEKDALYVVNVVLAAASIFAGVAVWLWLAGAR